MKIDSALTGTLLRDFTTTVNWRETMNYAAAVNDRNELYFDDEREGGPLAPPMYSVALTWKILGRIWEFIDTEHFPMDVISRQVHYTEFLEFHRPLQPGDELIIRGAIVAIMPHRSGTHVVTRFEAFDKDSRPVFTEFMGGLMRGVECLGDGRGQETLPVIPENREEKTGWQTSIAIPELQPFIYDGCSDIFFPIHTSRKFARQVGLPGIILQGTATLAYAVRELVDREAGGDAQRLKRVYCRFTGMVIPGTDITVQITGSTDKGNNRCYYFNVLNAEGKKALSGGYAEVAK